MTDGTSLREAIAHASDPVAVMQRVVDQAVQLIEGADGASLEVRRDDGLLEYVCVAGTLEPFLGLTLAIDTSMSGLALRTGRVERSDDTEDDPRVDRAAIRRTGIASMLCVPLSLGGESLAVLKVSSRRPHAFQDDDTGVLQRLTRFLGTTMTLSSELAQVTSDLLGELPGSDLDGRSALTARFVANVMTPGLVDDVEARARIEDVLERRSLRMVVQPVSDLRTGEVVGVEALARFPGPPERTPDLWFAEAHRVGLGVELELAAVHRALELRNVLPEGIGLSINAGPAAVLDPRLVEVLQRCDGRVCTIEVTEHDAVGDYGPVVHALDALRACGARIAVDDTGNGYAGLSHILSLRPEVIKIDRELTTGVDRDPVRQAMAGSLVRLAAAIDGLVVAEGVETEAEAETLLDLGIVHGQGWLLGRPVPAEGLDLSPRWHRAG